MKSLNLLLTSAAAAAIFAGCGAAHHGAHWSYEGDEGPSHWGELSPKYEMCQNGQEQSPINLTVTKHHTDRVLELDYKTSPLDEVNNGHTIKFDYAPGSYLTVDGKRYELLQFHFHAPSEHTVADQHHPIEFHLVHKSEDGKLAVIGMMVVEGEENPAFADLIANLTYEHGKEKHAKEVTIDMNAMLPNTEKFYHYTGSLTTPPCSEKVEWFVLKEPVEFSKEQIAAFEKAYLHNNRPVCPINNRIVDFH